MNQNLAARVRLTQLLLISVCFGDGIQPTVCNVQRQVDIHRPRSETADDIGEVEITKEGIHPSYYQVKVVCNCGNEFITGSTKQDIRVEVCPRCYSLYIGQQKAAQARGRTGKFDHKYGMNVS